MNKQKVADDERKSATANNTAKHSALISQLNSQQQLAINHKSISVSPEPLKKDPLVPSISGATQIEIKGKPDAMSSTTNSSGGKSATKLSVDHQATLDKGLKMKIKRTKPGTKTSEAKHEIVKAEQNRYDK